MKSFQKKRVWIAVLVAVNLGIVGYYLYDVLVLKTSYTDKLFRLLAVIFALLAALARLLGGGGPRGSLKAYERTYQKELGVAFQTRPRLRRALLRACRLYNENKLEKALNHLEKLLLKCESEHDAVPVLLFIAVCYTDGGLLDEAIKAYYTLLKQDPKNALAHSNLGQVYMQEGDFNMALRHYDKSIEYEARNYLAYNNRANCYFRMGEYEKAIRDAEQALEYKNNGSQAAGLLTIIYALQGDEENKKRYYHLAIACGEAPEKINAAIEYYRNERDDAEDAAEERE